MVDQKIFLFGIDRAGKTAMAETLKKGTTSLDTKPTLAFNIGSWVTDELTFQIWDAPGQAPFRKLWKNGFNKAKLLLFLLDTSEKSRFEEANKDFKAVINDLETRGMPLIFCFNKMDLADAKKNKNDAKAIFKLPLIMGRKVIELDTSVLDPNSIKKLKDTITSLVVESRF